MSKKGDKSKLDSDLESLYAHAKKSKAVCPNCKEMIELGGDFSELARAMELRIKFEAIKRSKGGLRIRPSLFDDEKEE